MLTVAGPLLVVGVFPFAVQLPIVLAAFLGLAAWILLGSRHLDGAVSRLGVLCGKAVLAGAAVAGLGGAVVRDAVAAAGPARDWRPACGTGHAGDPGGSCAWAAR